MPQAVILDTDIGTDIDDTWALAMLLNSPELGLKAVTTCHADTAYRATVAAKLLDDAGRSDVPLGVGVAGAPLARKPQQQYVESYSLRDYPGQVHDDGVELLIETVMAESDPVIVSIGPATNVAAALDRQPKIADRARFIGMHGGIRFGYRGNPVPQPEYNVFIDVHAFRSVLAAPWPVTLTPLDTCGLVYLSGDGYVRVRDSDARLARLTMMNYRAWASAVGAPDDLCDRRSTTLYDTVAVQLAIDDDAYLVMEDVALAVRDDGLTEEVANGRTVRAAMAWRDQARFQDFLIERLLV